MIRLGIIGCGIIAQEKHLPALMRLTDRIQVVAVCNHTEEKALKTRSLIGNPDIRVFTDWKEMIHADVKLDAVLIALPILMNYEVSKACLEAGIAVMCEKPAGRDTVEALKTLDFEKPGSPLYMLAETYAYKPCIKKAKELIDKGVIGEVHSIRDSFLSFMLDDNKFNQTTWRSHNEYVGGYMLDSGVHEMHAIQMLGGRISKVFGKERCINPNIGTTSLGFAICEHETGVITSFDSGWQHATFKRSNMTVFGTKGSMIIDDRNITVLDKYGKATEVEVEAEDPFYIEWLDFINAYEKHTGPEVSLELAIHDISVIEAIVKSSREGREITL